ncbi:MAG: hypothetical protein JRF33_19570 [Deltaproteobacteria bacterium]|nr:hypothetical protein [Deltaproteobacteria bacterium]
MHLVYGLPIIGVGHGQLDAISVPTDGQQVGRSCDVLGDQVQQNQGKDRPGQVHGRQAHLLSESGQKIRFPRQFHGQQVGHQAPTLLALPFQGLPQLVLIDLLFLKQYLADG